MRYVKIGAVKAALASGRKEISIHALHASISLLGEIQYETC